MPTDRYTKTVLTVIAAALIGIFAQNAIKNSQAAQDTVQKVVICDPEKPLCVSVGDVGQGRVGALFVTSH